MQNSKGKITIPTEIGLVNETLDIVNRWGADAVRDCDGVAIPDEILKSGLKIYSTYFVSRGDNKWANSVAEEKIKLFLMSEFNLAVADTLTIDIMKGYFDQQFVPYTVNLKQYWEVINRTMNTVVPSGDWEYDEKKKLVKILKAESYCEYTVNFLADQIWDSTQMYNYITNNWNTDKHIPFNAFCPKTSSYILESMHKWLDSHADTDVVRFTTFFYHFTLVFNDLAKEKFVDWFGYGASVSIEILDAFKAKYNYSLRAEDFVDGGYYNSSFRAPSRAYRDYIALVHEFVCAKAKELVDVVHAQGKEAMMFLGDNWIGTEPYGDHFKDIGLDSVVGSVGNGTTLRMIADIPHIKYSEGRFLPYFFPDTFYEGNDPVIELESNWLSARRAIMRSPVDRIGYGGYLSLALKFPKFVDRVGQICDEFRHIHEIIKGVKPYNKLTVGILNCWGKLRTWQTHMVAHALWYKQIYSYLGISEAFSGMAVDVRFISFDDVKNGVPGSIDVIINAGLAGTAYSGGEAWLDKEMVTNIRKWIYNGGGFIGIGEPSAIHSGGHYFQLAEALGVEKELGFTLSSDKYNIKEVSDNFIVKENDAPDFGEVCQDIYALKGSKILKSKNGNVQLSVNDYGKGRCCYIGGLPYNALNSNLLLKSCLYVSKKEDELNKWYCDNINCECSYYPQKNTVALINNTQSEQVTNYYDGFGNKTEHTLASCEIKWISVAAKK